VLLPIGIRHGKDGDEPEAAATTATAARCRWDSDAAISSVAARATAAAAPDDHVTSPTDDVITLSTPLPVSFSASCRPTSGGARLPASSRPPGRMCPRTLSGDLQLGRKPTHNIAKAAEAANSVDTDGGTGVFIHDGGDGDVF